MDSLARRTRSHREALRHGLGNIIEITDAQRRFTEDEAVYINALADFSIAKAALDRRDPLMCTPLWSAEEQPR
jgi:outer membrane protein TolC